MESNRQGCPFFPRVQDFFSWNCFSELQKKTQCCSNVVSHTTFSLSEVKSGFIHLKPWRLCSVITVQWFHWNLIAGKRSSWLFLNGFQLVCGCTQPADSMSSNLLSQALQRRPYGCPLGIECAPSVPILYCWGKMELDHGWNSVGRCCYALCAGALKVYHICVWFGFPFLVSFEIHKDTTLAAKQAQE